METQNERKPRNVFLISNQDYIHLIYEDQLKGGDNPLSLPAPTPYILLHQLEGRINPPCPCHVLPPKKDVLEYKSIIITVTITITITVFNKP